MDRRTAIRTLATATALPVLAPDDAAALLDARRALSHSGAPGVASSVSSPAPAALTAREMELVGVVADVILPRTDTPGATDVGVPAFIDLIVSEWMDEEDASELTAGLAVLDAEASTRFGRGLVECDAGQQLTLVQELDARLPVPGSRDEAPEGFYSTLKRLVVTGYFTTEVGAAQTGYRISPGTYEGCVVPGADR